MSRWNAASLPRNSRRVHWWRQNGQVPVLASHPWTQALQMMCAHGSCKGVLSRSESDDNFLLFDWSLKACQQMAQFWWFGSSVLGPMLRRDWIITAVSVSAFHRNLAPEFRRMSSGMPARSAPRSSILASFSRSPISIIWVLTSINVKADMIEKVLHNADWVMGGSWRRL